MASTKKNYWETKKLSEMTDFEWESLCDHCGRCCLIRLEDEDTGDVFTTNIACKAYDIENGGCSVYENRQDAVPGCLKLTPENISDETWIPSTCAYRLLQKNQCLPQWHHLITGSRQNSSHMNITEKKIFSEDDILVDDYEDHIVFWADKE